MHISHSYFENAVNQRLSCSKCTKSVTWHLRDPEAGVQITQLFVIHAEMLLVSDYETHLNGNFKNNYEDLVAVSLNIQFFRFVKFDARAV